MEEFDDQTKIVHYIENGEVKSYQLTSGRRSKTI